MTRNTSYKFAPLNQCIIKSLWENGHNSFLKNTILIRPVGLERGIKGLWQGKISDFRDTKLHRYNRFNIELLEGKKNHAFKDHCSKDHTSTVTGRSPKKKVCMISVYV